MNKNSVLELKRIRVGSYTLDSMKPGDLIEIKPKE
jgi:16S rRNA U516 pseudouridylate synthase RsuA-like enzyme